MVDNDRRVSACVWFLAHDAGVTFDCLRVRNSPLIRTEELRTTLRNAVESEIASARREGLGYAEIGGWAATKEGGCSSEGLVLALAGFSLARILGGSLGITTATARHKSATILRRLGGASLEADGSTIAPYYDPTYRCMMELLRFDSRAPNARYAELIEQLRGRLAAVQVISKPAGEIAVDFSARRRRFVPVEVPLGLEVTSDWAQPSATVVPALAIA
jgi:hypothetical protein